MSRGLGDVYKRQGYSNPEVDELLALARSELEPGMRLQLYRQAETLLLEDFAVLPIDYNRMHALANPRVEGYSLPPMGVQILHLLTLQPGTAD